MSAYDDRHLFRVTLQHIHQPGPDKPAPVFVAIISATDLADARLEAEILVKTLKDLVRVVDVIEEGVGTLPSIRL